MNHRLRGLGAALVLIAVCGCHKQSAPPAPLSPPEAAKAANAQFLTQKTYDPWILHTVDIRHVGGAYIGNGKQNMVIGTIGGFIHIFTAGDYAGGTLRDEGSPDAAKIPRVVSHQYQQTLNLRTGVFDQGNGSAYGSKEADDIWPKIWRETDITITGDPQAQQVTHANLFYLLSSTYPGSDHSIPPMGLSSNVYGGHIFWDADVWMLPALIVQHPEYAKPIVAYRYKLLAQARRNARAHGYAGAEYPWESAGTGTEVAPAEFAAERHITADVGWAAWQYYLWTGDKRFLTQEGFSLLRATANYWVSRVTRTANGHDAIRRVLGPDETAGVTDNDAYTVGVVRENLRAALAAARILGQPANPKWATIADKLSLPYDAPRRIPAESDAPMTERFAAKQADTLLLLYPLNQSLDAATQARMLDWYAAHTIKTGPAMTSSVQSVIAARLGRSQQSLDEFYNSYRPFERAPWDAFSEKRTTNNVYFLTGMAGCLQSVLYGFAGLRVHLSTDPPAPGTRLAGDSVASLYADPHLPPGWGKLVVSGIKFRGHTLTLTVMPGNKIRVTSL